MKPQHTPTPWLSDFFIDEASDNSWKAQILANENRPAIAYTWGSDRKEVEANAAFIVRAVNVHEELVHLLSAALSQIQYMRVDIKGLDGLPSVEHVSCEALETQLKDAIAKAEGK